MRTTYVTIVEDLRRRIDAGDLAPGERAPSTRALARRWKVANATAARALRELTQAGLLEAVPRSGMVVASQELSRERIVAAAIRVADEEGLATFSIRGVAARLDAPVTSLYRHVRSKDELLALMVDQALGELPLPERPPSGWRAQIELSARTEWQMMRRHPWLARLMQIGRPTALPSSLGFVDWVMRALDGTRLDAANKLLVHILLHGFIQGLAVNLEADAQATGETGLSEDDHMRTQEAAFRAAMSSGAYPHFAAIFAELSEGFDPDLDALFELGLGALLDGFTPMFEGKRQRRS
ncbi:TetR/AcrR family transcriptional regulator C-terminal domain-containing protein [Vulgatibacter incomptus]|uniref:Transcriptional regulator, GntR family / Transcriptional regulator, TetR family n=1 Tax=Vulgatibacter incomptus TaxID=1391653 RepID=A0A0K1PGM5_9BACT|nr:TetR/AcrR family transcriptional regulator C-terminal domain-containing protein [Vulgatibacter incomptus]AKU92571.1 Transcriptional regulator, GntR family / Transcriptional regulator, TetR family [Vulgatibacter incomptus]